MIWNNIKEGVLKFWWDNRDRKKRVVYDGRPGENLEVQTFLNTSPKGLRFLSKIARNLRMFDKDGLDEDATMFAVKDCANRRVPFYVKDISQYDAWEYWQDPYETWKRRKADCDDKSLLIKVLSYLAGIPDYRMRCSWVSVYNREGKYDGEHLNNLYLSRKKTGWIFIEGTYPGEWKGKYGPVRFSFNYENAWANRNVKLTSDDLESLRKIRK